MIFQVEVEKFILDALIEWKMGLNPGRSQYRRNRFKYLQAKRLPAGNGTYAEAVATLDRAGLSDTFFIKNQEDK